MHDARVEKKNGAMAAETCRRFLLDYFRAHAIQGVLKPTRKYEVLERTPIHLKIRTRNKDGRYVQTLFADLMTCKSMRYGEFRRVDLLWGVERKNQDAERASYASKSESTDDLPFSKTIPGPVFGPNGDPMPVDSFMAKNLGLSVGSRKEKSE